MYTATGILTPVALKQAALLFLVMLAGLFAGMKSSSLLDEKAVKTLVIFMLILSGAALVLGEVLAGG